MPTFKDYLDLARAGYKKKEIDALLAEDKQDPVQDPGAEGPAAISPKEEKQPDQEKAVEQPGAEEASQLEDTNTIKSLQDKIIKLESKLADAQKENTTKDLSGKVPTDPDEALKEIAKRFM